MSNETLAFAQSQMNQITTMENQAQSDTRALYGVASALFSVGGADMGAAYGRLDQAANLLADIHTPNYSYASTADLKKSVDRVNTLISQAETPTNVDASIASLALKIANYVPSSAVMPTSPTINLPNTPTLTVKTIDAGATPTPIAPTTITAPTIKGKSAPDLTPIVLPSTPALNVPTLAQIKPVEIPTTPALDVSWSEAPFTSAIADAVVLRLMDDLASGTYGTNDVAIQRVFAAANDKFAEQTRREVAEAERAFSSRGFPMPVGALNAAIEQSRLNGMRGVAAATADLYAKQAELVFEGRKFTIEQLNSFARMIAEFLGAQTQRLLEARRMALSALMEQFNGRVSALNIAAENNKTLMAEAEMRLKLAQQPLEMYKLQLEGAAQVAQLDKLRLEAFAEEAQYDKLTIDVYMAQLEAEKVKAEIYQSSVQAYRTVLEAKMAELQTDEMKLKLYSAQLDGEKTKEQIYSAQVSAFGEDARARATVLDSQIKALNGLIDEKRSRLDAKKIELEKVNLGVQANEALTRAWSDNARLYSDYSRQVTDVANIRAQGIAAVANSIAGAKKAEAEMYSNATRIAVSEIGNAVQLSTSALHAAASTINTVLTQT